MSLLLDALKKAELAKQAAKTRGESGVLGEAGSPAEPGGGEDTPAPGRPPDIDLGKLGAPEPEPVVTRESLPDISPSLEITSPEPAAAPRQAAPQPEPKGAPDWSIADEAPARPEKTVSREFPGDRSAADPGDAQRKMAQQVFEAKEVDYHPRRPFFITVGVLLACGAGYAGYLWWQLQPHSIYNAAALQSAPAAGPVAQAPAAKTPTGTTPAAAAPGGAPASPGAAAESATSPAATPGATATPSAAPPAAAAQAGPAPAPAPARPVTTSTHAAPAHAGPSFTRTAPDPALPRLAGPAAATADAARPRAAAAAPPRDMSPITVSPLTRSVDPQLQQGYDALQRGDLLQARDSYEKVLARDGSNRDALLGLAAIDMKNGDIALAQARYQRLLELDPRDPYALAGMTALHGQADPVESESQIKTAIADQPGVPELYFTLGNQLAAQNRWSDAQAAYFKAYTLDAGNPDFAFNLAVSLDQLHQARQALEYYRQAISLAASRSAAFDSAQAARRIKELSR
jgi:Tfp pilus assembly protein PilF